ncbi:MAG: septum formation initiator family protein [Patescibacteria group bacterium]
MRDKRTLSLHSSKLFFFTLSLVFVFLMWKFVSITLQTIESQSKIAALRSELEQMQSRQDNLKHMEEFFKSDFFAEREARMKFGLQKKNEQMVILQNNSKTSPFKKDSEPSEEKNPSLIYGQNSPDRSIRVEWWKYFFGD